MPKISNIAGHGNLSQRQLFAPWSSQSPKTIVDCLHWWPGLPALSSSLAASSDHVLVLDSTPLHCIFISISILYRLPYPVSRFAFRNSRLAFFRGRILA